jgi:hypothetical protein
MIKFASDKILNFIDWLNKNYGVEKPVYITLLHGWDCLKTDNDQFACSSYSPTLSYPDQPAMVVPADTPEEFDDIPDYTLECIAHEYYHHIQFCNGKLSEESQDEDSEQETEAGKWCIKIIDEYNDFIKSV